MAAPELEGGDRGGGGEREQVGDVVARRGRAVGVLDAVLALVVDAAIGVRAELGAGRGVAGEGRGLRRLGGIVEYVRLRVAWRHWAWRALQPRHVAGRVQHQRLDHSGKLPPVYAAADCGRLDHHPLTKIKGSI